MAIENQAEVAAEEPCAICGKADDFRKHFAKAGKRMISTRSRSEVERPPDGETLGSHTWTFLHTMAAYYPSNPSSQVQSKMQSLIESFADFYPCPSCASHMRQDLKRNTPEVQSREDLSQWFCQMHNRVNKRLGKPQFDCSQVMARWRASVSGTQASQLSHSTQETEE